MSYTIVGGNYFRGHNGSPAYTSLSVKCRCRTLEEVAAKLPEEYELAGGLVIVIDNMTGKEVSVGDIGK